MQDYIKKYLKYFGYGEQDLIFCEVCGKSGRVDRGGFDLHHIIFRSHGGSDEVENICCLCRKCHDAAHGHSKTFLQGQVIKQIHNDFLKRKSNG